jgi:hypothetical protein
VAVGVAVGGTGVSVDVAVAVGRTVGVLVGLGVGLFVAVGVVVEGTGVSVGVAVDVSVLVGVRLFVAVGVAVAEGISVGVLVDVTVTVDVIVLRTVTVPPAIVIVDSAAGVSVPFPPVAITGEGGVAVNVTSTDVGETAFVILITTTTGGITGVAVAFVGGGVVATDCCAGEVAISDVASTVKSIVAAGDCSGDGGSPVGASTTCTTF